MSTGKINNLIQTQGEPLLKAMAAYYRCSPAEVEYLLNPAGVQAFLRYPGAAEAVSTEISKSRMQSLDGNKIGDVVDNVRGAVGGALGLTPQEDAAASARKTMFLAGGMLVLIVAMVLVIVLVKRKK